MEKSHLSGVKRHIFLNMKRMSWCEFGGKVKIQEHEEREKKEEKELFQDELAT